MQSIVSESDGCIAFMTLEAEMPLTPTLTDGLLFQEILDLCG